jgi:hypothetical protein
MKQTIESLGSRLATIETRTGALSLIAGREVPAGKLAAIETMEQRIRDLESKPGLTYRGVWDANTQYNEGDFVTDHGSCFHANRSTRDRPGYGSDRSKDWTLAVKRGDSAKETR